MTHLARKYRVAIATLAVALLAGCATSTGTIDSSKAASKAVDSSESIVFGKFTLYRNGKEAKLDDGLFAGTTAFLHVNGDNGARQIVGQVGENGEFAWALEPGNYQVSAIDFYHRGERQEIEAGLDFKVPAASRCTSARSRSKPRSTWATTVRKERLTASTCAMIA